MSTIAAVDVALPAHRYPQREITEAVAELFGIEGEGRRLLERVHAASGVRTRHLAFPLEWYADLGGFGAANDAFIQVALDLGERALRGALGAAGLAPGDVDLVLATSVTGIAAPSLEARLAGRVGLREDVKRVPVFGLGCVAGASGLARVHDYLRGDPDGVAVLLAVELCSLTVQPDDPSPANLVASGLFGDGAAAVVVLGDRRAAALDRRGPRVVATRSRLYPDTERVMGWDVGGSGFRIVLARSVADVVRAHLGGDVRDFLHAHGLTPADVATWLAHPGGPRVIDAVVEAVGLPAEALAGARASLAAVGNLSSASVLHVLAATMHGPPPARGAPGLLLAMGPGFCSELVLLRW